MSMKQVGVSWTGVGLDAISRNNAVVMF